MPITRDYIAREEARLRDARSAAAARRCGSPASKPAHCDCREASVKLYADRHCSAQWVIGDSQILVGRAADSLRAQHSAVSGRTRYRAKRNEFEMSACVAGA